ncbi:hypothetical protein SAY86_021444 [Trapa natans]|uniref:Uncharacterized protein n=1 Tax=Trapa natans TaxID=22666 RepID=A0AAN7RES8_TRANT|nr:hypothetical protein SAY86_021444 [Trapa natans]
MNPLLLVGCNFDLTDLIFPLSSFSLPLSPTSTTTIPDLLRSLTTQTRPPASAICSAPLRSSDVNTSSRLVHGILHCVDLRSVVLLEGSGGLLHCVDLRLVHGISSRRSSPLASRSTCRLPHPTRPLPWGRSAPHVDGIDCVPAEPHVLQLPPLLPLPDTSSMAPAAVGGAAQLPLLDGPRDVGAEVGPHAARDVDCPAGCSGSAPPARGGERRASGPIPRDRFEYQRERDGGEKVVGCGGDEDELAGDRDGLDRFQERKDGWRRRRLSGGGSWYHREAIGSMVANSIPLRQLPWSNAGSEEKQSSSVAGDRRP